LSLYIRRTAFVLVPGHGTIKIAPKGGRNVTIDAPLSLDIVDKKGRPLSQRRKRLPKDRGLE